MKHTTLYRLHDTDGRLLYVGIAGNPGRRFEQHADDKPWWSEVARIDLRHFDDRGVALQAEKEAIIVERPVHNKMHAGGALRAGQVLIRCDVCELPIHTGEGHVEVRNDHRRDATLDDPAPWSAFHYDCDPDIDAPSYWIRSERLNSIELVDNFTEHIRGKRWYDRTDWEDIIDDLHAFGEGRFLTTARVAA